MKIKTFKLANITFSLSIISLVVGYALWAVLIPMQDSNEIQREDILRLQQEIAFNYPLGRFLLYVGFIGIGVAFILYAKSLFDKIKRK